ncbi:2-dehydropantoate 2-reductase [Sediminicoccus sp. KRV36]|uniref:ketopantoate reductase family protein n=1 Tax=Sediminicoccus sp. KRV36 TaxID=3133721 RepID=UPI00200BEBEB|nr:2-dehydropantoate 2-reductase [Sediminicoccus rosea]UPY37786.1 2-dehydropantoate 2-reductase [Sediminicoccus rosea]
MKITVFGTGAIGSHVAARLAQAGRAEVSVIARGPQLDAIRARGITVQAPDGDFQVRPRAEQDAAALGPQDAVIVTVKAPALTSVAEAITPLLGPETPVVFVINGIPWWWGENLTTLDPGGVVRGRVGLRRTIGGVVWSACTVTEPGVVKVQSATSRVIFGELDNSLSPRIQAIAAALDGPGMGGVATTDIRTAIWTKLLNNLTNGPICLLTRRDMTTTFTDPAILAAAKAVMHEGLAIAAALGHAVPGDPEAQILRSIGIAHKPSILQDLEAGRTLEFEALLSVPLQLAREAGVATPMLELLVALARQGSFAA